MSLVSAATPFVLSPPKAARHHTSIKTQQRSAVLYASVGALCVLHFCWRRSAATNIRYVAYSSDVGEAFRPVVPGAVVKATYGLAFGYGAPLPLPSPPDAAVSENPTTLTPCAAAVVLSKRWSLNPLLSVVAFALHPRVLPGHPAAVACDIGYHVHQEFNSPEPEDRKSVACVCFLPQLYS